MCFLGSSNKEWKVKLKGYMKYLSLCVKQDQTHNAGCWDPETAPSDPAGTPLWQQTESPRVGSSAPQTGPWLNPMRGGFCSPGRCLSLRQKGATHFINVWMSILVTHCWEIVVPSYFIRLHLNYMFVYISSYQNSNFLKAKTYRLKHAETWEDYWLLARLRPKTKITNSVRSRKYDEQMGGNYIEKNWNDLVL